MNADAPAARCVAIAAGWRERGPLVWLAIAAWFSVVAGGLAALWSYAQTPGAWAAAPLDWPHASRIERSTELPTLVLFAHPKCPCTRASLSELQRLATRLHGRVQICVVFIKPSPGSADWEHTDLWRTAAALPGARVLCDPDGVECQRFAARTSGLVLLYSPAGRLWFSGGITAARGHEGINRGTLAIEELARTHTSRVRQTPVFGCALHRPDSFDIQEAP